MKILLTGADGLLGSNVVRELLNRKNEVTVFIEKGKKSITLPEENIQIIYGDILDSKEVSDAVSGNDYVIHCAANTNIWPTRSEIIRRVNVEGTENVIEACLEHKIKRLISVGTANSFASGEIDKLGDEKNKYEAFIYNLDYMDSKRLAQDLVLDAVQTRGLNAIVVNPTFMIGPYDSKPSSGAMVHAVAHGKVPGITPGGKNYINVKDAAVGIANSLDHGRVGECYILGNENLTSEEMFNKIGETINRPSPKRLLPSFLVKAIGKLSSMSANVFRYTPTITHEIARLSCENHYYSSQKAVRELKLPQTPIENGVRECYNWFVSNGYIKAK
jgi:dihydroflavonol-4-reductase